MKKVISVLTVSLLMIMPLLIIKSCKKDLCKDKVCVNGGACQDGNCICPAGFTGTNCQTPVQTDPCANISCLNGGVCINGTCDCPTGYTGPNCGTLVNNDPCQSITCYNGGTCANGVCNCPEGYTGSDCSTLKPLVSVSITKVRVTQYPMTTSNGGGWDLDGGPDVFLSIGTGTTCSTTAQTGTYNNCTGSTLTYNNFGIVINQPTATITICLYDDDSTSGNDGMGGIYFKPSDYKDGYPTYFTLSSGDITMEVYVTWNF